MPRDPHLRGRGGEISQPHAKPNTHLDVLILTVTAVRCPTVNYIAILSQNLEDEFVGLAVGGPEARGDHSKDTPESSLDQLELLLDLLGIQSDQMRVTPGVRADGVLRVK